MACDCGIDIKSGPHHSHHKSTKMPLKNIDYSLYLVTDSTAAILGDKDLVSVVRDAIAGGMIAIRPTTSRLLLIRDRGDACAIS
jgi:hypothetical protein